MRTRELFRHRKVICVVVRLATRERAVALSLSAAFVTTPGTRGAMLKRRAGRHGVTSMHLFERLATAYGAVDEQGFAQLQASPLVLDVKPSGSFDLVAPQHGGAMQPVTPAAGPTWGLEALGIPALWAQRLTGNGILVGHLDDGIDAAHPALRDAVRAAVRIDHAGKPGTGQVPPGAHGTHTAGSIVGRRHQSAQVGVAPDAELVSACVVGDGDTVNQVLGGIEWALRKGTRVLSMSIGQRGFVEGYGHVIDEIRRNKCLPVIATGNTYVGSTMSPANYENALSVGAVGQDGVVLLQSGSEVMRRRNDPMVPDLAGPGANIVSCIPGGRFGTDSGTSMATPHIAGLAALLMQDRPAATPEQVEAAIFASCKIAPGNKPGRIGRGMPYGPAALAALRAM